MQQTMKQSILLFTFTLFLITVVVVSGDRAKPVVKHASTNSSHHRGFHSKCGTAEVVSHRVGDCMRPIFDIVEGNFKEIKTDEDLVEMCGRFTTTERCIRVVAKDCLRGIHRTATSAIASSTRKLRLEECKSAESRARYIGASKCCLQKGKDIAQVNKNHTALAQAVRDLPNTTPEEKMLKLCCVINAFDSELEATVTPHCPNDAPLILGIFHAMTDDAKKTLCSNPKCDGVLKKVMPARLKQQQIFVEPVAQILYMLGTDNDDD